MPRTEAQSFALSAPGAADPAALAGLVDRVVFHKPETGFCVLRVRVEGERELVTIVGEAAQVSAGELVRAQGQWETSPSYGQQFRARTLDVLPPTTRDAIEAYLASGMIKGVGKAMAKKLVEAFGEDVFEVIEREPARLREVPGVGRGLARRIEQAFEGQRAVREIMLFLHAHGLSPARAARIFEAYGQRAIQEVTRNPYRLAQDIRGIGFASADAFAHQLGIPGDSPLRLGAGLRHILGEAQGEGHCGLPRDELIARAAGLLEADELALEAALAGELRSRALVIDEVDSTPCVFLNALHAAEDEIAATLRRLAGAKPAWAAKDAAKRIAAVERKLEIELSEGQRDALRLASTSRLLVITGGPGTGKTTLVRAILAALEEAEIEILLAAPTGRAAKRLTETTGHEARTLHRLLEADPGRGFRRGPLRPLETDLMIVDEMSMVDIPLMQALLLALREDAGLILIGDVDQLPSIGPGRVLGDLIDSGGLPVVRLQQVFRQAAESRIVANAHRINQGQLPELERATEALSDFYAIRARSAEDGADLVLELVRNRIPARFGVDPVADIQVLCPTNRGELGARTLNERLQRILNPAAPASTSHHGVLYQVGDKIMQLENDYEREIYNGDLGRLSAIDERERQVEVEIDGRRLVYAFGELDRLAPAYAITVHKAQGSEYPVVVLPLVRQHGRMLKRNLVYTAITRAKRLVVLVAEPGALEIAVTGRPEPRRWSRLRTLLAPAG